MLRLGPPGAVVVAVEPDRSMVVCELTAGHLEILLPAAKESLLRAIARALSS
ncbi:hypothetical protein AB0M28_24105 [Streptomyces sp. NPDC051940]|uniref:hypothetical protein n=1 Tax=Streptomyces sp. NPDC051940 TaxID=3155675 RepID=UPI0034228211